MDNPHPALIPVRPNECGLAVTIPLTREEFLDDLSRPDEKDLVHHFRAARGLQKAAPEFCWQVYAADEATFAEAVCTEAERLGVMVRYGASLSDLTELLERFPVVTLVAHWRFVTVVPDDIIDAAGLLRQVTSPANRVQQAALRSFESLDPELLHGGVAARISDAELRRRVAGVIAPVAEEAERLYWDAPTGRGFAPEEVLDGLSLRLTRLEFEQAFEGCISPAQTVEFRDRLHTVPELIEAIPKDFSGLLDLTVCNSVIPAAPIRSKRGACLVAANREPAELKSRMYLYGLEISLLAKQPMSFVEVIQRVHADAPAYKAEGRGLWSHFVKFFKSIRDRT